MNCTELDWTCNKSTQLHDVAAVGTLKTQEEWTTAEWVEKVDSDGVDFAEWLFALANC